MIVSPALAGVVAAPEIRPAGPHNDPSACVAATYVFPLAVPSGNNPGESDCIVAVTAALVRPLLVTWIEFGPNAPAFCTRKLICELRTKLTGTAVPATVTLTPF